MRPDEIPALLLAALRRRFGDRWHVDVADGRVAMRYRKTIPAPPVSGPAPSPRVILDKIGVQFAKFDVPRPSLLPLRWGRDTDLLISAIQGLDPWLKDGSARVLREGYLPQPVVRFTGERDDDGLLRDGFLTSFVNLSCVQRVPGVARHVELLDAWIGALSAIGIHAGRLTIHGELTEWQRASVSGLTLFCDCDGTSLSDAVLLWNTAQPDHMATDIGSGLERLRWLLTNESWQRAVFGDGTADCPGDILDAIRTATLMAMNGIGLNGRGPRHAMNRVLRRIPRQVAAVGLGRLVRAQRSYWSEVGVRGPPWPNITTMIEDGVLSLR